MPSMADVDQAIRDLKLYAERFIERIATAKACVQNEEGLPQAVRDSMLRGIGHIVERYDKACESDDPIQALVDIRNVFSDLEMVISWCQPGAVISSTTFKY